MPSEIIYIHSETTLLIFLIRQKLDNIMPTLPGAEEEVRSARKFLSERLISPNQLSKASRKESIVSSTINQIGNISPNGIDAHG